jgi:hypothetical protein
MAELIHIRPGPATGHENTCAPRADHTAVFWLQGVTLIWMVAACAISLIAAVTAC